MNQLERQIMASVAVIYLARRLTGVRALKAYTLVLATFGVALFASVPHVVVNFLHVGSNGFPATYTFLLSAVTNTSFAVQLALLVGVVAFVSLTRDITRPVQSRRFA